MIYKIENQYFPCINWFKISNQNTYIDFLKDERWKKMSFRNRCIIVGSNGLISLSVPIAKGRDQKSFYRDIKIDYADGNWQLRHWRSIVSCYSRSPFFEYYADSFKEFFEKRFTFLFDLNLEIIYQLNKYLFDLQILNNYEFKNQSLDLPYCTPKDFQQIPHPIVYHQMFEERVGFQPNLSILDLLFMEGPNSKNLIRGY